MITVFGILHIVFGAIGILMGSLALMGGNQTEQLRAQFEGTGVDMNSVDWSAIEQSQSMGPLVAVFQLLRAVLLLVAGIMLVKCAASALKLNNIWVVLAIIGTIIGTFVSMKMMGAMTEAIAASAPDAAPMIKAAMFGGAMIGILIGLTYPIVSFIFLNRRPVKEFLGNTTAPTHQAPPLG